MSGGFSLDPNAVTETGDQFGAMSDKASGIKDAVAEAEVPEISWGLLGLATTYAFYKNYLRDYQDHLQQAIDGFTDAGELIKTAATTYGDAEQQVVQQLQQLADRLERIGDAPKLQA